MWLKGIKIVQIKSSIDLLCGIVGHGGGWGYSAHSVEAIRFCADADILLGGLGLFGGRGEYTAKIKVSQYEDNEVICRCYLW